LFNAFCDVVEKELWDSALSAAILCWSGEIQMLFVVNEHTRPVAIMVSPKLSWRSLRL
jgi:hypothetical protein